MSFSTILTTQRQNNLNYATNQIKNEAEDFFLQLEEQNEDYYCSDDLSSIQSTIESSIFSSSSENCLILNDYWLFNDENNRENSGQNEEEQFFSSSTSSSSSFSLSMSPTSSSNQLHLEDTFSFDYPSSPSPPSFYCSSSSSSLSPSFYCSSSQFSSNSFTSFSFSSPSAPFSSSMCSPSSPSYSSSMSSSSSSFPSSSSIFPSYSSISSSISSPSFSPPSSTLHHFHHNLTPSTKQQLLQQPQFHSTKLPQNQQHYKNQQLSASLSPFQKFRNRLVQISRRIGQSQQRRKFSLRNCGVITKTSSKTLKKTKNKCRNNININKKINFKKLTKNSAPINKWQQEMMRGKEEF